MSHSAVRIGLGTRVIYDGELHEVAEFHAGRSGTETVLRPCMGTGAIVRVPLRDLVIGRRVSVVDDEGGLDADDPEDPAGVVLSAMPDDERKALNQRAAHIREVLTGYRSGTAEFAESDEPRELFGPDRPLTARYEAKASELGVSVRTVQQWVADFRRYGEAGLARSVVSRHKPMGTVDDRWVESALEVMVEHTDQSRPSRTMVIDRANARVVARYGPGAVRVPSRATAYRVLEQLEKQHPTFR